MPLVFIHGVAVRKDGDGKYDKNLQERDSLIRRFALTRLVEQPEAVSISNPYWGDKGATFAWNHASLPKDGVEAFGMKDELVTTLLLELDIPLPEDETQTVLTIARASFQDAVDLVLVLAADEADAAQYEDLAALTVKLTNYLEHKPQPAWLKEVANDEAFYVRLRQEVNAWILQNAPTLEGDEQRLEAFGIREVWDRIREAISRVKGAVGNMGSGLVLSFTRRPLHYALSRFTGDVFVYLKYRGDKDNPGAIVNTILIELEAAAQQRTNNDPLIIIGHSMGGNIAYDILTYFKPDLPCDVLVTVGSQIALFEELKLFVESDTAIPANPNTDRVVKPANVKHWLNVYDTNDILSFAAEGVFAGVADYAYKTGSGLLSAHTTYFLRPTFHDRLGKRLQELVR